MSMVPENKFQQFSIDALQKATDYFNESLNIGKGGYGSVYKGVFDDGSTKTHVAVKGLDPESKQGNKEFETEIKMLSKCRYFHIVKLLGYCNEQNEMILVYEYMSRGALSAHIYRSQESLLTWEQHLKICIGAACGLDYLHTGTGLLDRVIHLDVKCANILLDDNWAAKIADFGLSKIGPANQPYSEVITDHIRGTPGYIDPQYRKNHKFSRKSDVYPFGVVLLEVLSGTRAMTRSVIPDPDNTDLAKWIQHRITNTTLNEVIDPRILSQIHPQSLTHFASTISRALHNNPKKRPTMSEVVAQLESALAYQLDMNPSTSIIEDDVFRHFNSPESLNSSETSLHNLSIDNKDSSEHQHVTTESKAEDSIDSEDSAVSSILGISTAEYLDRSNNIFGEPIRNKTTVSKGLKPTRENKAQVAYNMRYEGSKYDNALRFVKDLKAKWGNGITALCLLYNATGETLTYASSHNWFGDIGPSSYPTVIFNGQWGAYLHTKIPKMPSGSVAAVVYRGKYSDNAFCDRMIAWSIPWQRFTQDNAAYCEINEVGHFHGDVWKAIYHQTPLAGRESSAKWRDCYTRVTVESDTSPIYKAILSHGDVIVTSV